MADKIRRRTKRKGTTVNPFPEQLDKLIHERIRLGIVSALAAGDKMTFNELKSLLKTSDGNLSVHARRLEDAGYIESIKSFDDRMPKTEYRLLEKGKVALNAYLEQMEKIIKLAKSG